MEPRALYTSTNLPFVANQLLLYVASGELAAAESLLNPQKLLKEEVEKNSPLLLHQGKVRDYSGRVFPEITAFQYAAWALDRRMLTMLRQYLTDEEAKKQLEELEHHGVEYRVVNPETGENETKRDAHYDFSLISALEVYCSPSKKNTDTNESWKEYWIIEAENKDFSEVAKAQCYVPAHIAQEYCAHPHLLDASSQDLDESKDTLASFSTREFNESEDRFIKGLSFNNDMIQTNGSMKGISSWFPLEESKDSKEPDDPEAPTNPIHRGGLGYSFGIVRGIRKQACTYGYKGCSTLAEREGAGAPAEDLKAMQKLQKACLRAYSSLKADLKIRSRTSVYSASYFKAQKDLNPESKATLEVPTAALYRKK